METTILYRVKIGIMEKKMETTVVCWANREIMEKKMETTTNHGRFLSLKDRLGGCWCWRLVAKPYPKSPSPKP